MAFAEKGLTLQIEGQGIAGMIMSGPQCAMRRDAPMQKRCEPVVAGKHTGIRISFAKGGHFRSGQGIPAVKMLHAR